MHIFILLFSILISTICFWFGTKFIFLYFKVKNWDRIQAQVLSKKAEPAQKTSASRTRYLVRVEYNYIFQGNQYKNNKVYLIELIGGQVNHLQTSAQKKVDEIEEKVSIYVNPANPQESVLYCESLWMYIIIVVMGFVSILVGIGNYF